MFRTALLSIIVSLAAGQTTFILMCRTWCDAHMAIASECHHENTSTAPGVAAGDCADMVAAHSAILREDTRRLTDAAGANQAIVVPRFQCAHLTIDAPLGQEPSRASSVEGPPLTTVLRL